MENVHSARNCAPGRPVDRQGAETPPKLLVTTQVKSSDHEEEHKIEQRETLVLHLAVAKLFNPSGTAAAVTAAAVAAWPRGHS